MTVLPGALVYSCSNAYYRRRSDAKDDRPRSNRDNIFTPFLTFTIAPYTEGLCHRHHGGTSFAPKSVCSQEPSPASASLMPGCPGSCSWITRPVARNPPTTILPVRQTTECVTKLIIRDCCPAQLGNMTSYPARLGHPRARHNPPRTLGSTSFPGGASF